MFLNLGGCYACPRQQLISDQVMLSCIHLICADKKGSSGELLGIACSDDKSGNALHVSVSFSTLDISVVDHIPEELIAITIQGLSFGVALGIGPEGTFQRMQLSLQKLQIDDQLSSSRYRWLILLKLFCQ